VRWIHANGLSWDVIKPIALKYDLHPLALEDMLHQSSNRSKLDYYRNHAFCNIVSHRTLLVSGDDDSDNGDGDNAGAFFASTTAKKTTRDTSGHHFGFHTTRRTADEESVVDTSDGANSPNYGSGASTPAAPGSYAEYLRALRKAFKKIRAPEEAEKRTVS
jgi:Mg2+ and Co2+ transporter CorA